MSIQQSTRQSHDLTGARTFPPSYGGDSLDPRIVVAVDSTADSYAALRWSLREANRRGCAVLAVNVVDASRRADWRLERDPQAVVHEEQDRLGGRVARAMAEHEARTGQPVPPVQVLVTQGDLLTELAGLADTTDLLVLGRPQLHASEPLVHELAARCAVLLVDERGDAYRPS
jgi:nucleotide-binding universal stress UspA family protein